MSDAQFWVAFSGAFAGAIYLLLRWIQGRDAKNPLELGSDWPKFERFEDDLEKVTDEAVPSLLLERVDKLTDDLTSSRDALDAKASALLGFLGGGVSVLAILAKGSHAAPPITPLLTVGAAALLLSLAYSLAVLWGKPREDQFGLDNYCYADFLKDPKNRARLAAMTCYSTIEKSVGLFQDAVEKGRSLTSAQFFFVLGAVLLVLNSFIN